MPSLRIQVGDQVAYEGPTVPVPRVGDDIHHAGNVVRVESVVWDFSDANTVVRATIGVAERSYTF